jgi:hypothetical protein
MSNRSESGDLKRTGGESNPEFLWMSEGGVARAQVQADGTIKGVRFSDDGDGSLVEVLIKKPRK